MPKTNGISKYMEKYFEEKFGHLIDEVKDIKSDIKVIKGDIKKNGKCMHKIDKTMGIYKYRVKWLTVTVVGIVIILLLGVLNGVELITKGVLSFLR